MYKLNFYSKDGTFHEGVRIGYLELGVELAARYRFIAPKIVLNDEDGSTRLEVVDGKILAGSDYADEFDDLESIEDLECSMEDYEYKLEQLDEEEYYTDEWNELQAELFAVAAQDNINLRSLGWKPL